MIQATVLLQAIALAEKSRYRTDFHSSFSCSGSAILTVSGVQPKANRISPNISKPHKTGATVDTLAHILRVACNYEYSA